MRLKKPLMIQNGYNFEQARRVAEWSFILVTVNDLFFRYFRVFSLLFYLILVPGLGMPISSAIPQGLINHEVKNYQLSSEESIIFYTDGIAEQKQHTMYHERFKETFYKCGHSPKIIILEIIC
ncbi:hypothetical protein SAMN04488598_1514 [Halanaerobium congolense]|uniref:Stage II sporulation protein E (SpoIIE) n=2 Tax=Halanaerobium congolense TaxID=54121 RepID=A0A1M7PN47_9FIRM|nr:hypothetical protein C7953_0731 [Halanaerobium congolense]SDG14191.1 hypothetical protein SAMN04488598_1514 [Halanaerobium congolense]SET24772.1 hypothetical protein SAMN04515652_1494 [Halanaerobium congolense]SFP72969.1 hypothetical protein SAMN04488596_1474 [Halanaerobium congolense]SHN18666.1 hypothetical protein SAMN04515650_1457 [Halanaerobium congolense]